MTYVDRVLLGHEYTDGTCPECCYSRHEPHAAGCFMDLALSERGFCTREERDAARARIERAHADTDPPEAT
jgi:hypothetical protein